MTHYHDNDIRKALVEIAPEEKGRIEATSFGEIKGSYVTLTTGIHKLTCTTVSKRVYGKILSYLQLLHS